MKDLATIITIKDLFFAYQDRLILQNISLQICQGEYLGIVGPNGGGKTTLIKIILGINKPKSGSLVFAPGLKIGYVPQRLSGSGFDFPAKVQEVLKNSFVTKFEESKYKQILEWCQIQPLTERLISTLSGGELQKVLIARSLISDPNLLILDEPTTGIDAPYRQKFWELIKFLNQEKNIAIIVISHELGDLRLQASRIISVDGVAEQISSQPA